MSRDQRPRSAVMIDTGPLVPESSQPGVLIDDDAAPAAADSPPILLWSVVFLLTCAAVALAIALLPIGNF